MDSATRHWRFLRNKEFDIAEVSTSSYLAARDNDLGSARDPGVPASPLPPRLHVHQYAKGITKPADLRGKKIGVKTLMTSAILWMRGILQHEYGVPLNTIEWVTELDNDIDVQLPADLKFRKVADGQSIETMLADGELDAVFHSDIIKPFMAGDPRVGRLFPDPKAEETAYFQRTGIFPIMHVTALRKELVDAHPWLPFNLYRAFNEAKKIGMKRMVDPAHRAARLVSGGMGGAAAGARSRSVGVRPVAKEPQGARDAHRLLA